MKRGRLIGARPKNRESEREQGEKAARRAKKRRQRSQSVSQSVRSVCTRETWREITCVPALANVSVVRERDVNWNYTCVVTRECLILRGVLTGLSMIYTLHTALSTWTDKDESSSHLKDHPPPGYTAARWFLLRFTRIRTSLSDFNRDTTDSNGSASFDLWHDHILRTLRYLPLRENLIYKRLEKILPTTSSIL